MCVVFHSAPFVGEIKASPGWSRIETNNLGYGGQIMNGIPQLQTLSNASFAAVIALEQWKHVNVNLALFTALAYWSRIC